MAQSQNQQTNRMLEMLLNYMMQKKLTKQRQAGQMEYLGEQMRGFEGLEDIRHMHNKQENEQKLIHYLMQQPEVAHAVGMARLAEQKGDVDGAKAWRSRAKESMTEATKFIMGSMAGKDKLDDPTIMGGINSMSEGFIQSVLGDVEATERAKMAAETSRGQTEFQREKLYGYDIPSLQKDWAKLQLDFAQFDEKSFDRWLAYVRGVRSDLNEQGVEGDVTYEALQSFMNIFGSGKVLNPLSPEYQGEAMKWLGEIEQKLLDRIKPDQADRFFLQRIQSAYQIGKGGMPTPETAGLFPSEAEKYKEPLDQMKQRMFEDAVRMLMEGGMPREVAEQQAREIVGQLR